MSSRKSKATETVSKAVRPGKIVLVPCLCGRTPKLVKQECGRYSVDCECDLSFYPRPTTLAEMSRQHVAEGWNKLFAKDAAK